MEWEEGLNAAQVGAGLLLDFKFIWPILGSYGQETIQSQPKIILSTSSKLFEIWKLGNCKLDTHETWRRYVPLQHLSCTKK